MAQGSVTTCCNNRLEATVQRLEYEPPLIARAEGFTKGKPRHMLSKQRQIGLLNTSAASAS